MAVVTGSVFVDILMAIALLLYLFYWWFTKNDEHWDRRGVPCIKSVPLLLQAMLARKSQAEQVADLYQQFDGERFWGSYQFNQPGLMVRDPELIHKILVKDFTHFQNRAQPDTKHDPLSFSLFNLKGQVWRALRYKLTPTFSTGKLKGMFEQVSKCGDTMIEKIEELSQENTEVECKTFVLEFTVDVISSCAFGLEFEANSPEMDNFKSATRRIFKFTFFSIFRAAVIVLFPKLANALGLGFFPRELGDYFANVTKANLKYRKENNIQRNDYFQLLMTLKEQEESGKDMGLTSPDTGEDDAVINQMQHADHHEKSSLSNMKLFTDEVICANSFIFLLAGSESTSGAITNTLFELSRNPDVQEKLQQEVDSVLAKHGGWSFDTVKDMTYLDQVIQEAQRLYPVLPVLTREVVQDYKVPDTDWLLEKGQLVAIPVMGLHRDPKYYPDPDQFKPERFEGNNFKPNAAYLPYGDGPRICIAMRFAVMELKTCIARIMSQYSVKLSPKTQLPVQFENRSFVPAIKGGVWLRFEKRKLS